MSDSDKSKSCGKKCFLSYAYDFPLCLKLAFFIVEIKTTQIMLAF